MRTAIRRRLTLLTITSLAVLISPAYLRAYKLSGTSDAPTLLLGDTVLVNRAAYAVNLPYTEVKLIRWSHPNRGDMVLVLPPAFPAPIFKRVIGLPGETIEIRDNRVVVDGHPLALTALPPKDFLWIPTAHRMGNTVFDEAGHWIAFTPGVGDHRDLSPVRMKHDEYFLMGDNRDVSLDCREWGPLQEEAILGKVVYTRPTGARTNP